MVRKKAALLLLGYILVFLITYIALQPSKPDKKDQINILFVGNSYTTLYDWPYTLQAISHRDNKLGLDVYVEVYTAGDNQQFMLNFSEYQDAQLRELTDSLQDANYPYSLLTLWRRAWTKHKLAERRWDYVVLQPHSLWSTTEGRFFEAQKGMSLWVNGIKNIGAIPVFLMTWPRKEGSFSYRVPENKIQDIDTMYRNLYKATDVIERKYGVMVVPVADYWMYAQDKHEDINLYYKDGSHPSPEGGYLNALLFYKYLVNKDFPLLAGIPNYVTKESAQYLTDIAKMDIPR